MRDIPLFTTEYGIASLTLNQIPYTQKAYVRIQSSLDQSALMKECVSFCRACGAESIYATGFSEPVSYPEYTRILKMQADKRSWDETDAALFPVTEKTLELWREIYNQKSANIPNASFMSQMDAGTLLKDGDGYFVHRNAQLLGIGKASGDQICWVCATVKGSGEDVVKALASSLASDVVSLEVSSSNIKAIKLYEKMGFLTVGILSIWYQIF